MSATTPFPTSCSAFSDELGETQAERLRQVGGDGERGLPGTPLEQADVRPVHACALGELVHGHALLTTRIGD